MLNKLIHTIILIFSLTILNAQNTEWVHSFGGPNSDKGISVGTDTLGNVYLSGFFNNTATFGSYTIACDPISTFGNNKELFQVKMDSTGNVLWAIRGGNGSGSCCDDRALGMHVTPDGYSYITGTIWSSMDMGGCTMPWSVGNSADGSILVKIDPDGNCVWMTSFGADEGAGGGPDCPYPIYDADDHSYDVKVDADGFIYVTGFYSGVSAEFDGFTITNPTWGVDCQPKGYVGKLDSDGNWLWVHGFDGIKDQRGSRDNRLAIDNFSNVYVVGGFQNTGTFGPLSLTSNGEWDAFVFKMDKDGNWIWARNVGSNKTDRANGIAIDYCDNVYISGEYRNPMIFTGANASNGTDTLSHAKKRDIFVAKINTNGDWVWAKRARSKKTDKPYQMSVDENMQVYISGSAGDSLKFDNNITLSLGDTTLNGFVAQLDGSGVGEWVWAKLGGGPTDDDRMGDICEDGGSNVYAIGFFEESANYDGYSFNTIGTENKKDVVIWKLKKDQTVDVTPSNCVYIDVQPPGSGSVTINGTNVTLFPCLQNLSDSANQTFDAIPYTGYQLVDWDWGLHTALPSSTSTNSVVYTYSDDTLIVNFEVIPVDTITYIVQPPGSGTITVDGSNITTFPYADIYIEGINSNLSASPNAGYTFGNWDFGLNTPTPSSSSSNITVTWVSNDTVYVNFNLIPSYDITYLTLPIGAGNIDIDGVNNAVFPTTMTYLLGTSVSLFANNNPNFTFTHWTSQVSTLLPSTTDNMVDFIVVNNDTIIAHYNEIDTLWVITSPEGVATLEIESDIITTSPYMGLYQKGSIVNINAIPNGSNVFNQWNLNNNSLPDFNASTFFNFINDDTLFAYFNNVLAIENLGEDLKNIRVYPNIVDNKVTIEVFSNTSTSVEIDLINISGQKVQDLYKGEMKKNKKLKRTFEIEVSQGIYFIKFQSNMTNTSFKILKN